MEKYIIIYTDGACSGNPGPGGWGAILLWEGKTKKISGFANATTNNRMELQAVIEALKCAKKAHPIMLYTDSEYVMKGITKWIHGWLKTNWKNGKVKNMDLWKEAKELSDNHDIEWIWVKGHNGVEYNEIADTLAREAIIEGLKRE